MHIFLPISSSIDLFDCTSWKKSNGGGRWASFLPLQDCGGDTGHSSLMPEVPSRGNDKDTIAGLYILGILYSLVVVSTFKTKMLNIKNLQWSQRLLEVL
jgi:hypothetical protein